MTRLRPIHVYYEHPDWFRPLFAELERRGVEYQKLDAERHAFDPMAGVRATTASASALGNRLDLGSSANEGRRDVPGAEGNGTDGGHRERLSESAPLIFNRMSPSAWKRGRADAILYTLHWLRTLARTRVPVVNGIEAFTVETSKALQLSMIQGLGLDAPRTRAVASPALLPAAARDLEFPLVVKPNIGGSGAGIARFDSVDELASAVEDDRIARSIDGILLLQEFHPPVGDRIVRVETLEGRFLYAILVHVGPDAGFNLCPAEICRDVTGRTLVTDACPAGAATSGVSVEGYLPPFSIRREVEGLARAARLDVGGIEYLESARDGRRYYYDINALSNFVADAERVVGFDPTTRLVDALIERATLGAPGSRARREPTLVPRTHPADRGLDAARDDRFVDGATARPAAFVEPRVSVRPRVLDEEIAPATLAASDSIMAPIVRSSRAGE